MAGTVLNYAITGPEENLSSVIQFETYFTRDNHIEIHRAGSVHTWMAHLQDLHPARQLSLKFFNSHGCLFQ